MYDSFVTKPLPHLERPTVIQATTLPYLADLRRPRLRPARKHGMLEVKTGKDVGGTACPVSDYFPVGWISETDFLLPGTI